MYIKQDMGFNDLMGSCWSGAINTLKTIEEKGKEDELMELLESIMSEDIRNIPTMTEVNDYLWFEDEAIFEALGISESEEDEEEDYEDEEEDYCQKYKCEDCPKNMECEYALTF